MNALVKDYDEMQKMWPSVSEVDWNLFKVHSKTLEVKVMEKWSGIGKHGTMVITPSEVVVTQGRGRSASSNTLCLLRRHTKPLQALPKPVP